MAYYSKYTGKELEERLDRINDIPALIDKLFLNKEYLTELEVKCLIKEMIPLFYKDIPIDNKTIYWDNGVLKSVCTGEENNEEEEEEEDCQCLWELREHNGQQYIYSKLPVVTQYGITIYGNNGDIDLPSLYAGLPIDNQTIYWDNGVLKSLGGGGEGLDEEALRNYLLINEYVTRDELPSLNGYATESWVLNLGYIGPEGLKNYVDISSNQDINGKKNFKSGISINGLDIYQSQDDVIYLDANLVIRGGITMYSVNEADIPSIIDYIPTASTTTKGIASFDESFFTVDSNGKVSLINSSSGGGGIDETELEAYLTSNNYAKKSDIPSLVGYATESWVNTRIDSLINGAPAAYDTLKEIADVLQGNVNSIGDIITALGTKWTQDNTKIANWDTAYSWGNHANAGYALKTYVDSELTKYVTLSGEQTISGKKNFTTGGLFINGSQIIYDSTKKYWKLEGDLLVTGGITMYGDSVSGGSAGATTLGQLQNVGNWADSVADVDRIMYQAAGSSNWVAKSLSSIGGVSGDYLPLSGGTLTGITYITTPHAEQLYIDTTGNDEATVRFTHNGTTKGSVQWNSQRGIGFYNNVSKTYLNINDSGVATVGGHTIWHSGNFTPSNYLPLTGGTLTGTLQIPLDVNGRWGLEFTDSYGAIGSDGANNYVLPERGTSYIRSGNTDLYHRKNGNDHKIWDASNDGSGSGLDADLLDGVQGHMYARWIGDDGTFNLNTIRNGVRAGKLFNASNAANSDSSYRGFLEYGYNGYTAQFNSDSENKLYYRWCENGTWKHWRTFAFTDSNVASATKLQTARTIWGQWFDGSGNVSGDLNMYTSKIFWHNDNVNYYIGCPSTTTSARLEYMAHGGHAFLGGNVGIGTTSPGYELDVRGIIRSCVPSNDTNNPIAAFYAHESNPYGLQIRANTSTGDVYLQARREGKEEYFNLILQPDGGNVGIGTTSPGYTLDVNGQIRATGWIRSNKGVHIDGSGVHYTNNGAYAEIASNGNEIVIASTTSDMYVNYRTSSVRENTVKTWIWCSGTGSSRANFQIGDLLCSGGVTMYSDKRKKTILGNVELSLKDIANAPLIEHYYNSDDAKTTHVGSIAQYWASMNDWFCKLDNEGYYTMEIQNCALASAISIARELDRYESKTDKTIKQLKKRICQLEEEVERLRAS